MKISCEYNVLFNRNLKQSRSIHHKQNIHTQIASTEDSFVNKNITFKSSLPINLQMKNAAENILGRNIVFGPNEYKSLSKIDIETIREYAEIVKHTAIARFVVDFGDMFSKQINKKYPNGFVFVPVGRSPAFLGKFLEFQGKDVKYCPISGLSGSFEFKPNFIKMYKEYLDTIGLNKEFVNDTQKAIVVTDYSNTGRTLEVFEQFLALPEIGIQGKNVIFSPITYNGFRDSGNGIFNCDWTDLYCKGIGYDMSEEYGRIMSLSLHKNYTSIPKLYTFFYDDIVNNIFNKFYQNGNRFEENFDTKMMNFLIAERANAVSK